MKTHTILWICAAFFFIPTDASSQSERQELGYFPCESFLELGELGQIGFTRGLLDGFRVSAVVLDDITGGIPLGPDDADPLSLREILPFPDDWDVEEARLRIVIQCRRNEHPDYTPAVAFIDAIAESQ